MNTKLIPSVLLLAIISSSFTIKLTVPVNFSVEFDMDKLMAESLKILQEGEQASTSEPCDPESCISCKRNGEAKFCDACLNKNIVGTGDNRRCQGAAPEGCSVVFSRSEESAPECTSCDTENNYHIVRDPEEKAGPRCVKCDLSQNSLQDGICAPVPIKVDNCLSYSSMGQCSKCEKGFELFSQVNACVALPENCLRMDVNRNCYSCNSGYMREKGGSYRCIPITLENCLQVEDSNQDRCASCISGYFVNEGKLC